MDTKDTSEEQREKRQLTAYIDPDLHRRLRVHALQSDRSVTDIVEGLVRDYLAVAAPVAEGAR